MKLKNKLLIAVGVVIGALFVAWIAAAPAEKFKAGDLVPQTTLTNIHGVEVTLPSAKSKWIHLQFRRFAGCPICNLHLQSFVQRNAELESAGIHEVVVFHSPKESLLQYQGNFPFDVIGDPEKKLYAQYGVGTSIFAILDVRAWPAIVRGSTAKDKPNVDPEGGVLGRPADFLINAQGKIVASHYGRHAYDQWSVDELLALAK
ncbi:MAG: AhpC/TSA family protein [Gammaproteobacteria bacterium]|nr:AhpC/TSA family protein [Gammaproteobacteria bacterium]